MRIKESIRSKVERIAKERGTKIVYQECDTPAFYGIKTHNIFIDLSRIHTIDYFLSCFFHELGHHHCYLNGIWKAYHTDITRKNKKGIRAIRLTALRAEKWVDEWGAREMKKYFPEYEFEYSYNDPYCIKWFKDHVNKNYKL